jgi:hypothetical protein
MPAAFMSASSETLGANEGIAQIYEQPCRHHGAENEFERHWETSGFGERPRLTNNGRRKGACRRRYRLMVRRQRRRDERISDAVAGADEEGAQDEKGNGCREKKGIEHAKPPRIARS